jgi:hypothetical protein
MRLGKKIAPCTSAGVIEPKSAAGEPVNGFMIPGKTANIKEN